MNNLPLDNHPFTCYIYLMNDDFRDMMPTSEEFYASYAPPINGNGLTPSEQAEYESRESLETLLKEAHECLQHAVDAKLVVGGVEIVEVSPDGRIVDSVWSMNVDELGRGYSQNGEVIHNGLR